MRNLKLTFLNLDYKVDENKRTIEGAVNVRTFLKLPKETIEEYFTVSAKTKCALEDEWDEQLGKRIVESKLNRKTYQHIINSLFKDYMERTLATSYVTDTMYNVGQILRKEISHFSELTKVNIDE